MKKKNQDGVKEKGNTRTKTNTNGCWVIKSQFHTTAKRCGVAKKEKRKERKDKETDKRKKNRFL